ncbi:PQQ-binding-like beta-propeller repeat protein [Gemmatimonadota bacterium Y43]|uniref:YncE family protein n=1 Tax=Gaopeijia maritima TaxID=3119007 RepID=UPI0032870C33
MPRRRPLARTTVLLTVLGVAACGEPPGDRLLLTSTYTDEVIALDPADGRVVRRTAVDPRPTERDEPTGVAVAPDGERWVAVAQGADASAHVFGRDGASERPAISLGLRAAGRPGVDPEGRRVLVPEYWLGDASPGGAALLTLDDGAVTRLPPLCAAPHQAAWSPDGRWVAVPCALDDLLLLLDGATLAVRHRVALSPAAAARLAAPETTAAPDTAAAPGTVVAGAGAGATGAPLVRPMNVAWAPDSGRLWVTLLRQGAVAAIDTTGTEIARAPVPRGPAGIAVTPDGHRLIVPARDDFLVAVLDAATLETLDRLVVADDPNPHGVVISPDGSTAYVTREGTARSPGGVTALRIADGTILWRTEAGAFTLDLRWQRAANR